MAMNLTRKINKCVDGEVYHYITVISSNTYENELNFLKWCENKELYFDNDYIKNLEEFMRIVFNDPTHINKYIENFLISVYYKDESHPDVVELKLTWL